MAKVAKTAVAKKVEQPEAAAVPVPQVEAPKTLAMPAVHIPGVRLQAVTAASPGAVVDRLGAVKALVSQLCDIEDALAALVRDCGETEINGELYRATVSGGGAVRALDESLIIAQMGVAWCRRYKRSYLDLEAIRAEMGDAWCEQFEIVTGTRKKAVRVTARKRS